MAMATRAIMITSSEPIMAAKASSATSLLRCEACSAPLLLYVIKADRAFIMVSAYWVSGPLICCLASAMRPAAISLSTCDCRPKYC
ncbi:hypothetical protein D3C81_1877590 [compost metagenome]